MWLPIQYTMCSCVHVTPNTVYNDMTLRPQSRYVNKKYTGLARNIYIRCIYSIFGRKITKHMVIYSVYTVFLLFLAGKSPSIWSYSVYKRFWPTLQTLKKMTLTSGPCNKVTIHACFSTLYTHASAALWCSEHASTKRVQPNNLIVISLVRSSSFITYSTWPSPLPACSSTAMQVLPAEAFMLAMSSLSRLGQPSHPQMLMQLVEARRSGTVHLSTWFYACAALCVRSCVGVSFRRATQCNGGKHVSSSYVEGTHVCVCMCVCVCPARRFLRITSERTAMHGIVDFLDWLWNTLLLGLINWFAKSLWALLQAKEKSW